MLGMAVARIAAIALAFLPCTTLAQQPEMGAITVTISDQIGAIIPGAYVVVTGMPNALRFEAISDRSGEAVLHVYQGGYDLAVKARGFATYLANDLEVTKQTQIAVTLRIDQSDVCTIPYGGFWEPYFPLEHAQVRDEIPLIPTEQFPLPAKRLRSRWRWL
jgi:Carboxypeptidase regulatory-like domain